MIAAATSTPLPDVWRMSPGLIGRYAHVLRPIVALHNPLVMLSGDGDKKILTDPQAIRLALAGMGIK